MYRCVVTTEPPGAIEPNGCGGVPSPKSITACVMKFAAAGDAIVNTTGAPTIGLAFVVIVTVGGLMARTVTVLSTPATRAVTIVSREVVSDVRASPLGSVTTELFAKVPLSAEKITGAPGNGLPLTSVTTVMICTVPPVTGTVDGSARTETAVAAAPPTRTSTGSAREDPEKALITAVADTAPALKVARAMPPSVLASRGSTTPTEDVNVTSVPL